MEREIVQLEKQVLRHTVVGRLSGLSNGGEEGPRAVLTFIADKEELLAVHVETETDEHGGYVFPILPAKSEVSEATGVERVPEPEPEPEPEPIPEPEPEPEPESVGSQLRKTTTSGRKRVSATDERAPIATSLEENSSGDDEELDPVHDASGGRGWVRGYDDVAGGAALAHTTTRATTKVSQLHVLHPTQSMETVTEILERAGGDVQAASQLLTAPIDPDEAEYDAAVERSRLADAAEPVSACDKHWAAMTASEQHSVTQLGWSARSWEAGDSRPMQAIWDDFTPAQLAAAELLGFTSKNFLGTHQRSPQPQVSFESDVSTHATHQPRVIPKHSF